MAMTELDDGPVRLLGPDSSPRSPSPTLHDAVSSVSEPQSSWHRYNDLQWEADSALGFAV